MHLSVEVVKNKNKDDKDPCEAEIYFDEEGLCNLIYHLNYIKDRMKHGEHVHLMTPSFGMEDELSENKVLDGNILIHHLRLQFWDKSKSVKNIKKI